MATAAHITKPTRRAKSAPKAPAVTRTADPDTKLMQLARKWVKLHDACEDDAGVAAMAEVADQVRAIVPVTAAGAAAKSLIDSSFGEFAVERETTADLIRLSGLTAPVHFAKDFGPYLADDPQHRTRAQWIEAETAGSRGQWVKRGFAFATSAPLGSKEIRELLAAHWEAFFKFGCVVNLEGELRKEHQLVEDFSNDEAAKLNALLSRPADGDDRVLLGQYLAFLDERGEPFGNHYAIEALIAGLSNPAGGSVPYGEPVGGADHNWRDDIDAWAIEMRAQSYRLSFLDNALESLLDASRGEEDGEFVTLRCAKSSIDRVIWMLYEAAAKGDDLKDKIEACEKELDDVQSGIEQPYEKKHVSVRRFAMVPVIGPFGMEREGHFARPRGITGAELIARLGKQQEAAAA